LPPGDARESAHVGHTKIRLGAYYLDYGRGGRVAQKSDNDARSTQLYGGTGREV